jgi:hypothetical protein
LCEQSLEYLETYKHIAQKNTALPVGLFENNVQGEMYFLLTTIDTTGNQLDDSKEVVLVVSIERSKWPRS